MNKKSAFIILSVLVILNIFSWLVVYDLSKLRQLEVSFFDVGQGDSIFIETPQMQQILIDGGPGSSLLEKLAKEMPFWDRSIDLIILTHPEKDHVAGLLEVLKRYKVENILWTGIIRDTAEYQEWIKLIKQEKSDIFIAESGQQIKAGSALAQVLFPFENLEGKELKDSNNTSVVIRLNFGKNSFLFTGDINKSTEKDLLERGSDVHAEVLKVGHHGSKTSTSNEFIDSVVPTAAVISVGKDNKYGHPNQETLDVLAKHGIKIFRTDFGGDIKIFSDGENLQFKTQN